MSRVATIIAAVLLIGCVTPRVSVPTPPPSRTCRWTCGCNAGGRGVERNVKGTCAETLWHYAQWCADVCRDVPKGVQP